MRPFWNCSFLSESKQVFVGVWEKNFREKSEKYCNEEERFGQCFDHGKQELFSKDKSHFLIYFEIKK